MRLRRICRMLLLVLVFNLGCTSQEIGNPGLEPFQLATSAYPGVWVHKSTKSQLLMDLAYQHASDMARRGQQDHRGFAGRAKQIGRPAQEVCAESWPWQHDLHETDLWIEALDCWRASSGHWNVISKSHEHYGYGLSKSNDGIWYFCVLVAD